MFAKGISSNASSSAAYWSPGDMAKENRTGKSQGSPHGRLAYYIYMYM